MMSNELLQMLDKCNDQRTALAQKNKQLKQRIADLEVQLAAQGDGWTYVEDGLPPPEGVKLLLTRVFGRRLYIEEGRYESKYIEHGGFTDMSGIILSDNVIAYMIAPQPAPLRTAAPEQQ